MGVLHENGWRTGISACRELWTAKASYMLGSCQSFRGADFGTVRSHSVKAVVDNKLRGTVDERNTCQQEAIINIVGADDH